jgi:Ca2+-binding EF-hand superfamily protein
VTKMLLCAAAALLPLSSAALAQNPPPAPKPVARADYAKTLNTRFNVVDSNHDGYISKAELAVEQQNELQQARTRINQQLQAKFKELDTNKNGQLSLQEFMAATPAIKTAQGADQVMQQLDSNRDGKISGDEFRAPELAKFNKVDANHDGIVTPDEIKAAAGWK